MEKHREKLIWICGGAVVGMLFLLRMYTLNYELSFRSYVLNLAVPELLMLAGIGYLFREFIKGLEWFRNRFRVKLSYLEDAFFILVLGMCVVFAFEVSGGSVSLVNYEGIYLFGGSLRKKNVFPYVLMLIFPICTDLIFRAMKEEGLTVKVLVRGHLLICMLTVMEYLTFGILKPAWMVDMTAANLITLLAATDKYVWRETENKKKAVLPFLLYLLFWTGIHIERANGAPDLCQYILGKTWEEFSGGRSLYHFLHIQDPMTAAVFLIMLAAFLLMLVSMAGFSGRREKEGSVLYIMAFWMLAQRTVFGILYGSGIFPYQISLPWMSTIGLWSDTVALGILFAGMFEEKKTERNHSRFFSDLLDLLQPYEEDEFLDDYPEEEFEIIEFYDAENMSEEVRLHTEEGEGTNEG